MIMTETKFNLFSLNANSLLDTTRITTFISTIYEFLLDHKLVKNKQTPNNTIICIQETKWNENNSFKHPYRDHPSLAPFHTIFTNRSSSTPGGGTAILISPDIHFRPRPELAHNKLFESSIIELPQHNILIANIYITRYHSILKQYLKLLTSIAKLENKQLLIAGDFNAHHPAWCNHTCQFGETVADAISTNSLNIYNNSQPTRNDCIIDLCLGTIPNLQSHVIHENLSDHNLLYLTWNSRGIKEHFSSPNPNKVELTDKEWETYENIIITKLTNNKNNLLNQDPNNSAKLLQDIMSTTIQGIIATRKACPKQQQTYFRYSKKLAIIAKEKRKAYLKYRNTKSNEDFLKWKEINKKLKQEAKQDKKNSWDKFVDKFNKSETIKDVWSNFNKCMGKPPVPHTPTFATPDGTIRTALNMLTDYFQQMGKPQQIVMNVPTPVYNNNNNNNNNNNINNSNNHFDHDQITGNITIAEISSVIQNININKASGLDNITGAMIKHLPPRSLTIIQEIFNKSWKSGSFPDCWKKAIIHPIPKVNPPTAVDHYRPISLLPIMGKLLEKIITNRITSFTDKNNILPKYQYGFKKKLSTTHALTRIISKINSHINKHHSNATTSILLDLKAAYDSVNHDILLHTLMYYNFPERIFNWIKSFLSNRFSATRCIVHNKDIIISDYKHFDRGVPQGSPISPILFNIYIANISEIIDNFNQTSNLPFVDHQMYADDMIIFCSSNDAQQAAEALQKCADKITELCDHLQLRLNPKKCQSIAFFKSNKYLQYWQNIQYKIKTENVPIDSAPKYLNWSGS